MTMFPRIAILLAAVTVASSAVAAPKTYTKAQLQQLVNAGKFPPQLAPVQKEDRLDFVPCKAMVSKTMADIQDNYPVRTLLDAPGIFSMKAWTNDGAIVLTCSRDGRFVMQQSQYR